MCKDKGSKDDKNKDKTSTKAPEVKGPAKGRSDKSLKAKSDKISSKIFGLFSFGLKKSGQPQKGGTSGKPLKDRLPPRPTLSSIIDSLKSWKPKKPMKYPYTMGAKIVQFPYKFYYQNNWMWKFYPFGVLASLPIFWYISRLANSASNKATWAEKRRKEMEEGH